MNQLVVPSFLAGILTFLAPCTLPMVPGYLGFISGVSLTDLKDPSKSAAARQRIFLNGFLYVVGFSLVFIALGTLFALGSLGLGRYRTILARLGGIFILLYGLSLAKFLRLPLLQESRTVRFPAVLKPGTAFSSVLFGVSFALGWTPCIGPVLGSILLLATTTATVAQGAFLLFIFSLGLAIPFLLVAAGIASSITAIRRFSQYLPVVERVSGLFLLLIGILLFTDNFSLMIPLVYRWLGFLNYDRLLNYL